MKTAFLFSSLCFFTGTLSAADAALAPDRIEVARKGADITIRSDFSPEYELIRKVGLGSNSQINFSETHLKRKKDGKLFRVHGCGDDSTPWNINSTYIGANHGCSDGNTILLKKHGFTEADLGRVLLNEKGVKFYIVDILSEDKFAVLSDTAPQTKRPWAFSRIAPKPGKAVILDGGKKLEARNEGIYQYRPCARILSQKYLADGKELADGQTALCSAFDILEEYDVLRPESMLGAQKKQPGGKLNLHDPSIKGVLKIKLAYSFRPEGACVIDYHTTALCDFYASIHGGIQSGVLSPGPFRTHEYYIPKTLPFTLKGKGNAEHSFDFLKGVDFSKPGFPGVSFSMKQGNISDPANPPDTGIQFLGNRKKDGSIERGFGYALGFSMTEGMTVPAERLKNCKTFLWIHKTRKTYPYALGGKNIKAGDVFQVNAYRQYFDAARPGMSGTLYWHRLKDAWYVYCDWNRKTAGEFVKLPADLAGKTLEVVEKTPSVSFSREKDGIRVSVSGDCGRLVLKAK